MNTVVGLDVGSTKICCLVGEVTEENQLRIIGSGITRSQGIKQGVVVDVEKVSASILAAVEKAEQISGYHIENAYVGVTGAHISSVNSRGRATINRNDHEITTDDVERALENAQAIAFPHNREIVHVIPRGFMVDGENGVRDPVGIHGYRLDVEAHIVTGAMTFLQNLEKCMTNAGIGVTDFILQPLASGEAVLRESEREMGAIMVDIGGGTDRYCGLHQWVCLAHHFSEGGGQPHHQRHRHGIASALFRGRRSEDPIRPCFGIGGRRGQDAECSCVWG